MESAAAEIVGTFAVHTPRLERFEDSHDDCKLVAGALRVDGQNVHQVLSLVVLLLHHRIIGCLLDQREEELKLLLVQGILHCQHIVVAVVEDQVGNTLLASINSHAES